MQAVERRAFELTEVRASRDKMTIEGHAAVFNRLSEDLGGFREQVAPGTFAQTIEQDDVFALFNHNPDYVLGRNRAGTLQLSEDGSGLRMVITLPDTQIARDLMTSVERRDITGASFGFMTEEDSWERVDGMDIRTLRRVRLMDVSPVTYPAYRATDVAVAKRSLDRWSEQLKPDGRARRQRLAEIEG